MQLNQSAKKKKKAEPTNLATEEIEEKKNTTSQLEIEIYN